MPKAIYAHEAWPGVYRLVAPFDRRLNDYLKEGVRWFDFNGDLGKKYWYTSVERLSDFNDWCQAHDYDLVVHDQPQVRCPDPPTQPLNKHQTVAFYQALNERATILQWPTGAGKTLPCISLADMLGRALVVTPRTVVPGWVDQFEQWAPDCAVKELRTGRKIPDEQPDIVLCSWGMLGKIPTAWQFNLLVFDELHNAMHQSGRTKRARAIVMSSPGAVRLGLTATPVSVHMHDYWQQLDLICPHRYGSKVQWQDRFHRVTRDGYQGARVVHEIRPEKYDEYVKTIESITNIVGQEEVAHLYPPVTWRREKLPGNGRATAPENLKAWQKEQGRLSERRAASVATYPLDRSKPLAIVCYLRETAQRIAELLDIPCITGEQPAHKRMEVLQETDAFVATMMSINEGLNLSRFQSVYVVESYPVPRYVEQVVGRFPRAYSELPISITFLQLAGTSDDVITQRLVTRLEEQDKLYRSGKLRRGLMDTLSIDIDSEDFLAGLKRSFVDTSDNEADDSNGGWE